MKEILILKTLNIIQKILKAGMIAAFIVIVYSVGWIIGYLNAIN